MTLKNDIEDAIGRTGFVETGELADAACRAFAAWLARTGYVDLSRWALEAVEPRSLD